MQEQQVNHYLISFLGNGNYKVANYTLGGESHTTRFFTVAANHFIKPDKVLVVMTKESYDTHYQELVTCLPSIQVVKIPSGGSEAEIWESFMAIVDSIPNKARVSLDITHGFRFQPLMGLASLIYMQSALDVRIDSVLYGNYVEGRVENPVTELSTFLTLIEWSYGVRSMQKFGQFAPFAAILQDTHRAAYTASSQDTEKPKTLSTMGAHLRHLGDALEVNHMRQVAIAAQNVRKSIPGAEQDADLLAAASPLKVLLGRLNDMVDKLDAAMDERPSWQRQINHLTSSGQYQQVITICRESIIVKLCQVLGHDCDDYDAYQAVVSALGGIDPKEAKQDALKALATLWGHIADLRNAINHAFIAKSDKTPVSSVVKNVHKIADQTVAWLDKGYADVVDDFKLHFESLIKGDKP